MHIKNVLPASAGLIILGLIYSRINIMKLAEVFAGSNIVWLSLAMLMLIPLIILMSLRLWILAPVKTVSFSDAIQLTMSAGVLNMILPSKMGDLAKSHFMVKHGKLESGLALSLVVFERFCDVLFLLLWCLLGLMIWHDNERLFVFITALVLVGLIFLIMLIGWPKLVTKIINLIGSCCPKKYGQRLGIVSSAWHEMHRYFWGCKIRLMNICLLSMVMWLLNLVQIWLFIQGLRGSVPLAISLGLTPLAILIGMLPLTFAGVGTRDAALIFFYSPFLSVTTCAAVGVLCTLRYIVCALAGLPFFTKYLIISND